jgi:hypothetical protein
MLVRKYEESHHLRVTGIDENIILIFILKKCSGKLWIGFKWLGI